jgi:hypothetical protein
MGIGRIRCNALHRNPLHALHTRRPLQRRVNHLNVNVIRARRRAGYPEAGHRLNRSAPLWRRLVQDLDLLQFRPRCIKFAVASVLGL